jgi:hypothetical protein
MRMIREERASQDSPYLVQEGCLYLLSIAFQTFFFTLHHHIHQTVFTNPSRSLRIHNHKGEAVMQGAGELRSATTFARLARIVRLRGRVREVKLQRREPSPIAAAILRCSDQ